MWKILKVEIKPVFKYGKRVCCYSEHHCPLVDSFGFSTDRRSCKVQEIHNVSLSLSLSPTRTKTHTALNQHGHSHQNIALYYYHSQSQSLAGYRCIQSLYVLSLFRQVVLPGCGWEVHRYEGDV